MSAEPEQAGTSPGPRDRSILPGFDGPINTGPLPEYSELTGVDTSPDPDPLPGATRRRQLRMALIGGTWGSPWYLTGGGRRGGLIPSLLTILIAAVVGAICLNTLRQHGRENPGPWLGLGACLLLIGYGARETWYAARVLLALARRGRP
jgi:hypothetical protein